MEQIQTVYSVEEATNVEITGKNPFIIANEKLKRDQTIGRYYTVFDSFDTFLKHRSDYPHCHELLVDHKSSTPNQSGRLVFDFDIKYPQDDQEVKKLKKSLKSFESCVKQTISQVVNTYIDPVLSLDYIWSTCQNDKKFSKHLTVKGVYFDDWINLTKLFYTLFSLVWDASESNHYLSSDLVIDKQIARKSASLRMVESSKIGGNELKFDKPNHTLVDSLIRVYRDQDKEKRTLTLDDFTKEAKSFLETKKVKVLNPSLNLTHSEPAYPIPVFEQIFEKTKHLTKYFKMGSVQGKFMTLLRTIPGPCYLSKKEHESDNAYLLVKHVNGIYQVKYGCHRDCHTCKTKDLQWIKL